MDVAIIGPVLFVTAFAFFVAGYLIGKRSGRLPDQGEENTNHVRFTPPPLHGGCRCSHDLLPEKK